MIRYKEQLLLDGEPVFSKIGIETPLEVDLGLPADACFLYIEQGDGQTLYAPANINATAGTVILSTCGMTIGNMIAHELEGGMESVIVHFNRRILEEIFQNEKPQLWEELQTPINQYLVQNAADELVKDYFHTINKVFENRAAVTDNLLKLKLREIVTLLLQTHNSEPVRQIMKSLFSEREFSFKEMVDAHLFTPATVTNLAQLTHCSISTFKRKFRETYGDSPGQYLMQKRLDKVAEEIRISDDAISNIGYRLGFESPEHLSRAFKKRFGQPPSAYRMSLSVK